MKAAVWRGQNCQKTQKTLTVVYRECFPPQKTALMKVAVCQQTSFPKPCLPSDQKEHMYDLLTLVMFRLSNFAVWGLIL